MHLQREACVRNLIIDFHEIRLNAYLPLTYVYSGKTFWKKITHPSKLLEIQQNLSDDQAKAKLIVGRYVFKMDKMSLLPVSISDLL